MIYIIWSSVRCFSANTGTKQKTPYTTLNTCKVFPGTIFKYLQGLTSSYTIYFNFFHYTVKSMLLSWLTHAHGYVHGYVRACSYMFMHVKFWLPVVHWIRIPAKSRMGSIQGWSFPPPEWYKRPLRMIMIDISIASILVPYDGKHMRYATRPTTITTRESDFPKWR